MKSNAAILSDQARFRCLVSLLVAVVAIFFAPIVYGDSYVPTLAKTNPTGGTHSGYVNQSLSFSMEATDSGGNLTKIELWVSNNLVSTKTFSGTIYYGAATFNRTFTTSGSYNVSAVARDSSGNASSWIGWTVTVTNRTPTATRNSPASSVTITKGSSLTFSASGADADGNLRGIEWYRAGNYLGLSSLSGSSGTATRPETFNNAGTYTIEALVHDVEFKYAPSVKWTVTVTEPTGNLTVTVQDQSGSTRSGAVVVRYPNGDDKTTNSSGQVTWSGIPTGAYSFEAYYEGANAFDSLGELWADASKTVSTGSNTLTLRRDWPFAETLRVYRVSDGQELTGTMQIVSGTQVRIEALVRNKNAASKSVRTQMRLDRDKSSSWDFDQPTSYQSVSAGGTTTYSLTYTPTQTGTYYKAVKVETNPGGKTDAWNWASAFEVVPVTGNLTVTVQNQNGAARSGAVVVRYPNGDNKTTDTSGQATWSGIPVGAYSFEAYYEGANAFDTLGELWADASKTVVAGNNTLTLRRDWPHAETLRIYRVSDGLELTGAMRISAGTQVRVEALVRNKNAAAKSARASFRLDRDKLSNWDFDQATTYQNVAANSTLLYSLTFTAAQTGLYYKAVKVETNPGGKTDAWDWSPAFEVVTVPVPSQPVSSGVSTTPTFSWSSIPGTAGYRLMVAATASVLPADPAATSCSGCIVNVTPATNYYSRTTPFNAGTQYFWQVQAQTASGYGAWSARVSFTTATAGAVTVSALNPSPVTGSNQAQTLTIYGSGFKAGMTATLTRVSGGTPVVASTSSVTATQAKFNAVFGTTAASWTVKLTNPDGSASSPWSFRVIEPAVPPTEKPVTRLMIDTITSPKTMGTQFAVTVRALDSSGATVPTTADIQLSTSIGLVKPNVIHVVGGIGTAQVALDTPSCKARIEAVGAGANGSSNEFTVQGAGQCRITGRVTNMFDVALDGATVTLTGCGNPVTLTTSGGGKYTSNAIPTGRYTMQATYLGRSNEPVTLEISNGPGIADFRIDTGGTAQCNPNGLAPILFVPGVMGSTTRLGVFPHLPPTPPTQLTEPPYTPDDDWLDHPSAPGLEGLYIFIVARWDVLARTIGNRDATYGRTIALPSYSTMFIPTCMIVPVPYDWRMDPREAYKRYLLPRIKAAKQTAGVNKVRIIAHSMGGLLVRAYLQSPEYGDDIDRFAMIGTPNDGAAIAYLLAHGGNPLRADSVVADGQPWYKPPISTYTIVSQAQYGGAGNDLESLYPPTCRDAGSMANCAAAMRNPELPLWTPYRKEMAKFFQEKMPSIRALLARSAFLREDGQPDRGADCSESVEVFNNDFLAGLNGDANVSRMGPATDGTKIRTKVFAGTGQKTVEYFKVGPASPCSTDTLSPRGEYKSHHFITTGDGTVLESSVEPSFLQVSTASPKKEGEHSSLIEDYAPAVADFILGQTASTTARRDVFSSTPLLPATASVTAPDVWVRVAGRARPYLTNAAGLGCGLKPGTTEVDERLPGCNAVSADPVESALAVAALPNGTYTVTLHSTWEENSRLSVTADDGTIIQNDDANVFCHGGSRVLTLTVAGGTATLVRLDGPLAPPSSVFADPGAGTPRQTTVRWTATSDSRVTGYNVYSRRADEPRLALLAQVMGTSYAAAHAWSGDAATPVRQYAIAARLASGEESTLTEFASNNDADHDNLTDVHEARYGTDPSVADTDGDGAMDGDEVASGLDPLNPDTDGDGYADGAEVTAGADPLSPASTPGLPPAPQFLTATATSATVVTLSWSPVPSAAGYQLYRRAADGSFTPFATSPVNSFTDSGRTANTAYVYQVRALDANNTPGMPSNTDLATTVMFTDDPIVAGTTPIKAVHLMDLRTAVNAVRTAAGLPAVAFTNSSLSGARIRVLHLNELRASLDAARSALGLPVGYSDPVLVATSTPVRAIHLTQLRQGVR